MQTVYEAAGGADFFLTLANAWHARVMADEVVSHAFSHGIHPDHCRRLAAYWAEALGGPPTYSDSYGDETSVVRMHSGNGPHGEMDRRAIACFDRALTDVGLANDSRLRKVLYDYFAWATTTTMSRYHRSADDVPDGLRIQQWSWDGLVSEMASGDTVRTRTIASRTNGQRGQEGVRVQTLPRITVEVPVLRVGSIPSDYEELGSYVDGLRRRQGLHMTLLHIGILEDFSRDIAEWTKGNTSTADAIHQTVSWLHGLPILGGFSGQAERLVVLGGGSVYGLEVEVPQRVRDYQVFLVQALRELLDGLLVDNVDDFILSSRALGFRYPRWKPHIAVGRPKTRGSGAWEIAPLAIDFGESRIRNRQFLPAVGSG